uniref:TFIIS N-terminal domain-containing protein n=1 Tax=Romanomermis culicivorax TaxID=13658 RepID=A0A915KBL2_ROMCU
MACYVMEATVVDPQHILDTNANILDNYGGIGSLKYCRKFVKLSENCSSLVQRCVYLNILNATPSEEVRQEILAAGAWNVLHDWLKESEVENIWPFVKELLKTFIQFPLTIELLKLNNIPKIIRRLSKRLDVDSEIRDLAADIVLIWKDIIVDEKAINQYQQPFTSIGTKLKKKRFGLKMLHDRNSLNIFSSIDPNIDLEEEIDEYSPPVEPPPTLTISVSNGNGGSDDVVVLEEEKSDDTVKKLSKPTKASLKSFSPPRNIERKHKKLDAKQHVNLFDKLKAAKSSPTIRNTPSTETAVAKGAPPPSKTFSSKFRPTGFETDLEAPQPLKKFKIPKKVDGLAKIQTNGAQALSIPEPLKPRPTPSEVIKATVQKRTLSSTIIKNNIGYSKPSVTAIGQQTPVENTLVNREYCTISSPSVKTVPVLPPIVVKEEPAEQSKQKRLKMSPPPNLEPVAIQAQAQLVSADVAAPVSSLNVTSPLPVSPVPAPATKPKPMPPKQIQLIESDIFMAALEGTSTQKAPLIRKKKNLPKTANGNVQMSQSASSSTGTDTSKAVSAKRPSIDQQLSDEPNFSTNNSENDSGRKRVRWAKENELVKVQLFEVDEINVNRLKLQGDYKHCEMLRERAYMEQKRRQNMGDEKEWKLVPVDGLTSLINYGSKSNERDIQAERQKSILAEVFLPECWKKQKIKRKNVNKNDGIRENR